MKDRRHWTPRYVLDRASVELYARAHPGEPWWTSRAVRLLDELLRPGDRCFEWGSGRSTCWLAARTASVVSVEHNEAWYERVRRDLDGVRGAELVLAADDPVSYPGVISGRGTFGVVVVDGLHRDRCAVEATSHLDAGGVLVLDNAERYVPTQSRSPQAIGDRHETDLWQQFTASVADWRRVGTTNGISDTILYFKP